MYDLFVTIESIMDSKLSETMKECWTSTESLGPNSVEEIHQNLLRKIVHMLVTTRGHSKTPKITNYARKKLSKGESHLESN